MFEFSCILSFINVNTVLGMTKFPPENSLPMACNLYLHADFNFTNCMHVCYPTECRKLFMH